MNMRLEESGDGFFGILQRSSTIQRVMQIQPFLIKSLFFISLR